MLRLDPNNLPPHLKSQIAEKLAALPRNPITPKNISLPAVKSTAKIKLLSPIHEKLWQAVSDIKGIVMEFKGAVPNRRFSLDIAIPHLKIAVEVDGWQYHGKHKSAHTKDRERQNLLTLNGWRILRYTAKQINENLDQCVHEIKQLIVLIEVEKQ